MELINNRAVSSERKTCVQKSGSNLSPRSMAILAEHPNGAEYLSTFTAEDMERYCRAPHARCFVGSAPTLNDLCEAYGENICVVWLSCLIYDLNNFVGQRQQTPQQSDALAWMLLDEAKQYKLTEVMYFFYRYKIGLQGEFYGGVNSHKVLSDLKKFKEVQGEHLCRIYKQQEEEQRERERIQTKKLNMSYDTYLWYTAWSAIYGDENALDALEAAHVACMAREKWGV